MHGPSDFKIPQPHRSHPFSARLAPTLPNSHASFATAAFNDRARERAT